MSALASQITSLTIVYLTVYSGTDQREHQSAPLAFVRGIHQFLWLENGKDSMAFSDLRNFIPSNAQPDNNVWIIVDNLDQIKKDYPVLWKVWELTKR